MNCFKYPRVAAMARDILGVQASSVGAESTFSLSGRILDEYRTSLTAKHVEMLVCGKSWLNLAEFYKKDLVDLSGI